MVGGGEAVLFRPGGVFVIPAVGTARLVAGVVDGVVLEGCGGGVNLCQGEGGIVAVDRGYGVDELDGNGARG